MSNTECEECFVGNWGLSKEEFMCILVKNYEEYGEIEYIHFAEIGKFYLTDWFSVCYNQVETWYSTIIIITFYG